MRWKKTQAGIQALQERSLLMSARQRQVLIVVDGQRSATGIAELLGDERAALLDSLQAAGWIAPVTPLVPVPQAPASPLAAAPVVVESPRSAVARKSLAAARLYLSDMLLMTRKPEASAWASQLQACSTEADLVDTMAHASVFFVELQGAGVAAKVVDQLMGFLPPAHLPAFNEILSRTQPAPLQA